MSKAINKYSGLYSNLDDVIPLYQIFHADEYILKNEIDAFKDFITHNKLAAYYDIQNPLNYSQPNNYGGYKIINPAVWNIALSILGENIKDSRYIIEFSRGDDKKYNELFCKENKDVYKNSFECLCKKVSQEMLENSIIINVNAPLPMRNQRNLERFKRGGHLVAEETMNSVYKKDVFVCDEDNYLIIKNIKVPVFFVENNIKINEKRWRTFL
jgi:hypothetical protein